MATIPESYFISTEGPGIAGGRYPDLFGEYVLSATEYKGLEVLLYKHISSSGQEFYMLNYTETNSWLVANQHQPLLMTPRLANKVNPTTLAPSEGWFLHISLDNGLRMVNDTSIRVKAVTDCIWSEWTEGECSKDCGSGFKTFTRKIIKAADSDGECLGEGLKTEHCNVHHCPGITFMMVLLILVTILGVCGAVTFILHKKGYIKFKTSNVVTLDMISLGD